MIDPRKHAMPPVPSPSRIVWFRNDLRLHDNPALAEAARGGAALTCVYIHAPEEAGAWAPGAASRWWLHHSLHSLDAELRAHGQRLIVRHGPSLESLMALAAETNANPVYSNHVYDPLLAQRDQRVANELRAHGIDWLSLHGNLWFNPDVIVTKQGGPYRVFTPYYRALQKRGIPDHVTALATQLPPPAAALASVPIDALALPPAIAWDAGLRSNWKPGAPHAITRLHDFLDRSLALYPAHRDIPIQPGTSRLSPHLHFGEISPRQIARAVNDLVARRRDAGTVAAAEHLLREVAWREFAHSVLHHFPRTTEAPLDERFARFPWSGDGGDTLRRWQRGRTGIPIVDAGMRELWTTGWMHNRARMIAASYLTKHLGLHWQLGARWFWDTLVDADLANNTFNWQWSAGCGADAAPYFRVFNPVSQGEKFDPHGGYVRQWVPELRGMSTDWIHQPWNAPVGARREAGIESGERYPAPLITPEDGRKRALERYRMWKDQRF